LKVKEFGRSKDNGLTRSGQAPGTEFAEKSESELGGGEIPRLRGPTRRKSARKKKSGRSARDDNVVRVRSSP